jgi:hypothetical protein
MGIDLPKVETPYERILRIDIFYHVWANVPLGPGKPRIVDLDCGHKALTRNLNRMICPRCTEMLRRSIATGEEDYETFRHGHGEDRMVWEGDPCRGLNERNPWRGLKAVP